MKKVVIIAAPSGSGKTSIVKEVLKSNKRLEFSISATTRSRRHNEIEGVDYYFMSIEDFNDKIKNDEFVEYEEVYNGLFYGTLKSELDKIWNKNNIPIFDVDVVGGVNLKKIFGENALSIFIKPPSIEELRKRLINRSTETPKSLEMRINKAKGELEYQYKYDYILVNNDLQLAISQIKEKIKNFIS